MRIPGRINRPWPKRFWCAILALGALPWMAGCGGRGPETPSSIESALMPGADLVVRYRAEQGNASPFQERFARLRKRWEETSEEKWEVRLRSATGLEEEDVLELLVAADLDTFPEEGGAGGVPDLGLLDFVVGIRLGKPFGPDRVRRALGELAEDSDEVQFDDSRYRGVSVLTVRGEGSSPLLVAFLDRDRLLYVGSEPGVRGALERLLSGRAAAPGDPYEQVRALVPAEASEFVVFLPTPRIRSRILSEFEGRLPGRFEPLGSLEGLAAWTSAGEDSSDLVLAGLMKDPGDAGEVHRLTEDWLAMGRLAVAGHMGDDHPPFLDGVRSSTEGQAVAVTATLTGADLDWFEERLPAERAAERPGRGARGGRGASPSSREAESPASLTVRDMRYIATAVESYGVDENAYPGPTEGHVPTQEIAGVLEPTYIKRLPREDGWHHPFLYWSDGHSYRIASGGADGIADRPYEEANLGSRSDPDEDIVYEDGSFRQWPERRGP